MEQKRWWKFKGQLLFYDNPTYLNWFRAYFEVTSQQDFTCNTFRETIFVFVIKPFSLCLTDFQLQIRVWFFPPHWYLLLSSLRNSKTFSQFCLFWTLWVAWDEVIKFRVFVIKGRSTAWSKVTVAINLSRIVTLSPTLLLTPPRATLKRSRTWRAAHVQIVTC